jgi:DNA-binding NarL/FixJ family response regulator
MLMLSEGTVKVYVSRIIQKTGSNTRVGVALWALRNGWIQESAA